jgi:alcohol dehydrogenase
VTNLRHPWSRAEGSRSGRPTTHHFSLNEFTEAYDVFNRAADTGALKVVLTR